MRLTRALVAACLALACVPPGPEVPTTALLPPRAFPQRDLQLPSGLRVVIQENHVVPLVTVAAVYGTGGTSDPPGADGLAHLIEHLTFRSRDGAGARMERLRRLGGPFNAATDPDTTLYYAIVHRDALEDALAVELSRLLHPLDGVTQADFDVERRVVMSEAREHNGGARGPTALALVQQRLFPAGHPLARAVGGSDATLATVTLPQARDFADRHYVPENCTLVVSGDVDAEKLSQATQGWPAAAPTDTNGKPTPHLPPVSARVAGREPPWPPSGGPWSVGAAPIASRTMVLAWSLPGASARNEAQLLTLGALMQILASVVGARAEVVLGADATILMVYGEIEPDEKPGPLKHNVLGFLTSDEAVAGLTPLVPEVRRRASLMLRRQMADPLGSAMELTRSVAVTGRPDIQKDAVSALAVVTADTLVRLMRSYVRAERAVTLIIDPQGGAEPDDEAPVSAETRDLAHGPASDLTGMSAEDILRVAHPPGLRQLPRFTLSNGLQVVAIERPGTLLAELELHLPGGSALGEPYGDLVSRLSTTTCHPEVPLGDVGGTRENTHGRFASDLSIVVPERNLRNGLAELADQVRCREIDEPHYQVYRSVVEHRRTLVEGADNRARRGFWWTLYPNHPYGRTRLDLATLQLADRTHADGYVSTHFRPNGALAVVVSARSSGAIPPLMEEFLARWPAQPGAPVAPLPPPPVPVTRAVGVFPGPRLSQALVQVGCRLPSAPENEPALDVLEKLVDEQAFELRERWGATYGLGVSVSHFPGTAHLVVSGLIDTKQVGAAVSRLLTLLGQDATAPDERALTVARWEVARGFDVHFATSRGLSGALVYAAQLGWSADDWDRYPARLAAVDAEAVRALMKTCAGREVIVVTGDAKTLTAQLKAAGVQ